MHSRLIVINVPGIGVGDVRNSSSSNHSLEKLLRHAYENDLNVDFSGLESIGLNAFVNYDGSVARKSSVTARLAARSIHGLDDFAAMSEMGGGDETHLPIYSQFASGSDGAETDVFLVSIGNDETIVPAFEYIEALTDGEVKENLLDVVSAPLVRNECIVATFGDFREASSESNPTFALACLQQISKIVDEILGLLGTDDALLFISATAIDATSTPAEYRNELTPMMFHTPVGQTHDLGLRLLSDVGPSIAEFFSLNKSQLIGASMGKWMFAHQNPQESEQTPIHS
jgi:hypothetical protein